MLAVTDAWKELSAKHVNSEFVDAVDGSDEPAISLLAMLSGKKLKHACAQLRTQTNGNAAIIHGKIKQDSQGLTILAPGKAGSVVGI